MILYLVGVEVGEEGVAAIFMFHQIVGGGSVFVLAKGFVAEGVSNTVVAPVEEVVNQTEIIGIGGKPLTEQGL